MKQRHHFEHTSCAFNISYDDDPGYDHSRPVVSRDYNLSGMIKCERTFAILIKMENVQCPPQLALVLLEFVLRVPHSRHHKNPNHL